MEKYASDSKCCVLKTSIEVNGKGQVSLKLMVPTNL